MATKTPRSTEKSARRRRITLATGVAAAVVGAATLLTLPAGASPAEGHVYGTKAKGAVDGSYIVMLKDTKGANSVKSAGADLADQYGGKVKNTYSSAINGFSAKGLSAKEARQLAGNSQVEKVVQNHTFTVNETQSNPPSWGLDRIDQKETKGDKKYTFPDSAGEGVTAFVIDTGVRMTHKDFGKRAKSGFDAIDGGEADDGQGHGTHVAGTIAGTDHGVAKKANIVAVRVLDDQGSGTTEQVVKGIDWVTKNAKGPSVANMSLGGPKDEALDAAVQKAVDKGITFAVAAGNESQDADNASPARVKDALTVAASDDADKQADFSNFGKLVDIYAPGVDIVSATNTSDDATETLSGTSMASPHVAGAAALFLGENKDAKPADVAKGLSDAATKDAISNPSEGTKNELLNVNSK
ncbi:S8 family peptidase [Streptomyces marispadix]|jgi:subtilisin family serine protease|uniref:S8 family peptidase n=1 Tax=Streptomyces marispadix TaxID=2922868 RepID=A0ABS9T3X4_9ACTN|nr:S8 family peptidase [Streptomyces marispadix]MCH6163227.1 S8 family peptidase [Streptomyces marispadix]